MQNPMLCSRMVDIENTSPAKLGCSALAQGAEQHLCIAAARQLICLHGIHVTIRALPKLCGVNMQAMSEAEQGTARAVMQ